MARLRGRGVQWSATKNDQQPNPYCLMPFIFAGTLFISAFLLFAIQPMLAKVVLPVFGGTPAVWNTCMVFFQTLLLLGYAYAHALTQRANLKRQFVGHGVAVGLGLAAGLAIVSASAIAQSRFVADVAHPVLGLLAFLLACAALPFFAISAIAPLLQHWFAQTEHRTANDPYFLYTASNLGSMAGLLGYPLWLDRFPLTDQTIVWLTTYGILIVLLGGCAHVSRRFARRECRLPTEAAAELPMEDIGLMRRWRWLALGFVPASMLYGVTTFLTTDVAAVPMLWMIPLALYLLSFVVAFGRWNSRLCPWIWRHFPVIALAQTFVFAIQSLRPVWLLFAMHLATFLATALACHGRLAIDRPPPRSLTRFYFWLSLGGVLGGAFNTLIAPLLFESVAEYPLALVLACLMMPRATIDHRRQKLDWQDLWLPLLFFLFLASLLPIVRARVDSLPLRVTLVYGLPAAICYAFASRPTRFALGVGAILLAGGLIGQESTSKLVYCARTFFGIIRVYDSASGMQRRFVHGSTVHGIQRVSDDREVRRTPLSYYFRNGPIGQVFTSFSGDISNRSVAVLGLGAGTLASYAENGQSWTFYELDPAVAAAAEDYFTFLSDARERGARCDVRLGDGRLTIAGAGTHEFDLLFADAFSSDAVPVHLLTREAFELYFDKLSLQGVIVVNITNRCLDLEPLLARLAEDLKLSGRIQEERSDQISAAEREAGKTPSRWVVFARNEADLRSLAHDARWRTLRGNAAVFAWTDTHSDLFSVFRWDWRENK